MILASSEKPFACGRTSRVELAITDPFDSTLQESLSNMLDFELKYVVANESEDARLKVDAEPTCATAQAAASHEAAREGSDG